MAKPQAYAGTKATLWSMFGWYKANPINLTDQEVRSFGKNLSEIQGLNNSSGNRITDSFKANSNPIKRMADMATMAESDTIGPLLDIYVEETTQPDLNKNKCIWFECNDSTIEKDLNDMLDRINYEDYLPATTYGVAGTGNSFRRVLYNNEGIQQLVGVGVTEMTRLWEPTTRRLIGFKWQGQKPRKEDQIFDEDDTIFPPWSFIHYRRIARDDTEYGVALLDKLYTLWRKLEMSMDQMVLYRLHTMPNRHAMFVDCGDQDLTDSMETMHLYAQMVRQKFSLNNAGMDSRFDMPALDSILYIPVRTEETNTRLEKMEGDKDVPDIPDIEELSKKIYGGARIPKAYVGYDDKNGGIAQASLVSQDIRFARVVRNLRRPIVAGTYRLGQLHLALTGKDPGKYKIQVKMSRISSIEEEVNVAVLEKQVAMAGAITDLCQSLGIPNREILDLVFREYLSVPRYFIDIAKLGVSLQAALGGNEGEGGGMGGMGGLGGIGGADLDMGPPGGMEGGPDELGSVGGEGGEEGGPPVESKRPQRKRFLYETSNREQSVLNSILRGVSKVNSLDARMKEAMELFTWRWKTLLQDHRQIVSTRKVSLVEDYMGERLSTEAFVPSTENRTADKLLEWAAVGQSNRSDLFEGFKKEASNLNESKPHEAAKTRKRMGGGQVLTEDKTPGDKTPAGGTPDHDAVRLRRSGRKGSGF